MPIEPYPGRRSLLPLLLLAFLSACADTLTLEQSADKLHGQFVIAKEQAVKITRDPAFPDDIKRTLATGALAADPLANSVYDLLLQLDTVRKGIAAGTATQADLDRLNAQLANLILTARGPIESFVTATEGAK